MLTYCRLKKGRVHFVIVFNLTRFAGDKYDRFALRSHLQSVGISLRSGEPLGCIDAPRAMGKSLLTRPSARRCSPSFAGPEPASRRESHLLDREAPRRSLIQSGA